MKYIHRVQLEMRSVWFVAHKHLDDVISLPLLLPETNAGYDDASAFAINDDVDLDSSPSDGESDDANWYDVGD
jgi:hypothetical protein